MRASLSDAEALRRLRRDPDATVALYDRHVARLVAALASASPDRQLAFDLAQETFARVLQVGHRVRLEADGSAWPWLWTVARNLLRDSQRRYVVERGARQRLGISAMPYDEQTPQASSFSPGICGRHGRVGKAGLARLEGLLLEGI
jgi:DNA-directed RNA polymerase specialized sigma24 family protein